MEVEILLLKLENETNTERKDWTRAWSQPLLLQVTDYIHLQPLSLSLSLSLSRLDFLFLFFSKNKK